MNLSEKLLQIESRWAVYKILENPTFWRLQNHSIYFEERSLLECISENCVDTQLFTEKRILRRHISWALRLIEEGDCTGYSMRYVTRPQQTAAETKEPRGNELRASIDHSPVVRRREKDLSVAASFGGEGEERNKRRKAKRSDTARHQDNTTLTTTKSKTTTRREGRTHVTRRLAGATKYCACAIQFVTFGRRQTWYVRRVSRVVSRNSKT